MEIKQILRQLRAERHETQKAVALDIGIAEQHYQAFEAGSYLPGLENLCKLADHFEVSLDYLAGRSSSRERLP